MGYISKQLKNAASSQIRQLKSVDVNKHIQSAIDTAGINAQAPKLEIPSEIKNINFDGPALKDVKLPGGVTNYIPKVAMDIFGDIKLPSGIGGISFPQLPDLSSVASEVDNMLSGIGFNTDALGIRNITDILNSPNLGEIKTNVYWQPLVDTDNIPDVTKSLDNFDISGIQSDVNKLTSGMPDMESIDISKFFLNT